MNWKIFIIEAFLFSLTLSLGIVTAFRLNKIFLTQKIKIPQISFGEFILNFLLATLFILLIVRLVNFKKGKELFFKTLFILAVFLGGLLCLEAWTEEPLPLIIIAILIFWWLKFPSVLNQDILIVLGIAGVGGILGLALSSEIIIVVLIIFSIYDWISVYKTKHMVKMAKEMMESRAILALVIPPSFFGFKESLREVQPGGKFLVLGGGDVVFPLLFCVSVISQGILSTLIVAMFSLIGLFTSFYFFINQKIRQPIPALPPIAFWTIIGYLLTKIL